MVSTLKRGCGCQAYEKVFTFNRWKAQGFSVKRGEKSISLPLVRNVESEDEETGEVKTHKLLASSHVFCRCQVEEAKGYEPGTVFRFKGKSIAARANENIGLECGCKAYVDVLTAGRWRALGYYIRPGESACHRAGKQGNTPIFCRCQVQLSGFEPDYVSTVPAYDPFEPDEIPFEGGVPEPDPVPDRAA